MTPANQAAFADSIFADHGFFPDDIVIKVDQSPDRKLFFATIKAVAWGKPIEGGSGTYFASAAKAIRAAVVAACR